MIIGILLWVIFGCLLCLLLIEKAPHHTEYIEKVKVQTDQPVWWIETVFVLACVTLGPLLSLHFTWKWIHGDRS